jgi:hypothetical protein
MRHAVKAQLEDTSCTHMDNLWVTDVEGGGGSGRGKGEIVVEAFVDWSKTRSDARGSHSTSVTAQKEDCQRPLDLNGTAK